MPDGKDIKKADYSGGKKYPLIESEGSPNFNIDWLRSQRAFDIATESELKSDPGISEREAKSRADKRLKERRDAIRATKTFIEPLSGAKATTWEAGGLRPNPEISLNPNFLEKGTEALMIHERDHTKLDMPSSDKEFLERNEMQNALPRDWKDRISSPDEMRARSQVFRNAMKKAGIADPFTDMITPDHIKQMREKYGVGEQRKSTGDNEIDNIQQFLRNTSEESATELLNTVAEATPAPKAWGLA